MTDASFFDPDAEVDKSARNLPHWFQPGVATFVTFRTADSMPATVVGGWVAEMKDWLRDQGMAVPPGEPLPAWEILPPEIGTEYRRQRDTRWQGHLDACHGRCDLRDRGLATIVIDSLRHFDGVRYDLDCAIVMPNHVHLLAQFRPGTTCRGQCESWLHFTAWQINKRLGRKGAFWQGEPFHHLVRSGEQFLHLRRYIARNGSRANLPETDYLFWSGAP